MSRRDWGDLIWTFAEIAVPLLLAGILVALWQIRDAVVRYLDLRSRDQW